MISNELLGCQQEKITVMIASVLKYDMSFDYQQ